ncbi:MAG TPA: lysozyme inhibitor LprI family protein [Terracidiphilus sp.]|nr:lysozyme inhibitor LprI family protein [Terracidiphilus sp.]
MIPKLLTLVLGLTAAVFAQAHNPQNSAECQFGGGAALDHDAKLIADAPTCSAADEKLHDCQWGSSADTQLAPIVIQKCEKIFLNRLSAKGKANYQHELHLCAYEYAQQEGTLYISERVVCEADVAEDFATRPERANLPILRASFDCARARTPSEKAICSDRALGDADIVLNRVYRSLVASSTSAQRPALIRQQKGWLQQAIEKCNANSDPLPASSRDCLRKAFEDRFTDLDGCSVGGVSECLQEPATNDP